MEKTSTKQETGKKARLRYSDVPKNWAVCYNGECPRNGECLRHMAYALAPATEHHHLCVLPQAWQGKACREFAPAQPQQLAWGLSRLFDDVPGWQATAIRHELMALFGSRSTYYRVFRGEFLVTPERQAEIAAIFASHGFSAPRHYDRTSVGYFFQSPGFGTFHSYNTKRTHKRLTQAE